MQRVKRFPALYGAQSSTKMQDLRLPQCWPWGFWSSGLLLWVGRLLAPDVLNEDTTFDFKGHWCLDSWSWKQFIDWKCWEYIILLNSIIIQEANIIHCSAHNLSEVLIMRVSHTQNNNFPPVYSEVAKSNPHPLSIPLGSVHPQLAEIWLSSFSVKLSESSVLIRASDRRQSCL